MSAVRTGVTDEMIWPKCQCPYWLHEACLAKAMFEAGGCPSCRIPTEKLDEASLLGSAADNGGAAKATQLLQNGTPPSPRFLDNSTPLIRAGKHGHKEVLRILLNHGASVSEQNNRGRTAIHWAVLNKHRDAVKELFREEDLQGVDKMGNTLLHLAVSSRSVEMVALVLDKRASTSAQDHQGRTALHLVAEGGEYDMIKPLISKSALVDAPDRFARTPLHYAARNRMSSTAKELLNAGALESIVDSAGCTPRDLANEPHNIYVRWVFEARPKYNVQIQSS